MIGLDVLVQLSFLGITVVCVLHIHLAHLYLVCHVYTLTPACVWRMMVLQTFLKLTAV